MYNSNMKTSLKTYNLKGKNIKFCTITKNNKDYFVVAIFDNKQVGYCNFCIDGSECKLSRIVVTKKEFLGYGIGNIMFGAMENIAYKSNAKYISAIFIPRCYDDAWKTTSTFYKNHNMTTFYGDNNYSEREEISKYISSSQDEYSLPIIEDAKLYDKICNYNYTVNDLFSSNRSSVDQLPIFDL